MLVTPNMAEMVFGTEHTFQPISFEQKAKQMEYIFQSIKACYFFLFTFMMSFMAGTVGGFLDALPSLESMFSHHQQR